MGDMPEYPYLYCKALYHKYWDILYSFKWIVLVCILCYAMFI